MVEHLNIYKILIEKVAKYLLLPGIELDINLNIRVSLLSYYCRWLYLMLLCRSTVRRLLFFLPK